MIFVDVRPMFVSFCLHQACPPCQHSRACDPPRLNTCSALHIAAQRFKRCWSKLMDVDGCQSSNEPSGFPFHASNISTTSNGFCGSRDVRCQEMSRDVKRCQEMSRVCFRDVNSKAGELSVVPVDHVISCHDHVQFDWHRYHRSHWQDLSSRVEPSRAPSHQA